MKLAWLLRLAVPAAVVFVGCKLADHLSWQEAEVAEPPRGAAADDEHYALRKVLAAAGSSLQVRGSTQMGVLPPVGATLVLDSFSWDIFPEHKTALKAWVRAGGHLVVAATRMLGHGTAQLDWVPVRVQEKDPDGKSPAGPRRPGGQPCHETYVESPDSIPAFEWGRKFHACLYSEDLRPLAGTHPSWQLLDGPYSIAMRVPFGEGAVSVVADWNLPPVRVEGHPGKTHWRASLLDNQALPAADDALVAVALLDARPEREVWIFEDRREPGLPAWLWEHARTPLLLGLGATALALWRLIVRFGPREAPRTRARRSVGEQVRGTGAFIAAHDPQALHAAARRALDEAARSRIERWRELDDAGRAAALARRLAPAVRVDTAALQAALGRAPRAAPAQWLDAVATLEETRRALLAAAAPPLETS